MANNEGASCEVCGMEFATLAEHKARTIDVEFPGGEVMTVCIEGCFSEALNHKAVAT